MPKVIVCTMFSSSHEGLADICVPNLERYCKKHGYELRLIKVENDKWEYKKHETFKEWMGKNEADVIFYCDIDTLITDHSQPIENFLDDKHSFYITMDFNELNGGSIIIKNTEAGREFNDYVLSKNGVYENEQNCFNDQITLDSFPTIKILNHPSINSYSYDLYIECVSYIGREDLGDWHPGNFLIHFPGLSIENRIAMMNEFKEKIIE